MRSVGPLSADRLLVRVLEQIVELADTIEPRYCMLVLLAAFSGLRRGELLAQRRRRPRVMECDVLVLPVPHVRVPLPIRMTMTQQHPVAAHEHRRNDLMPTRRPG